jgi:hypothetical protein
VSGTIPSPAARADSGGGQTSINTNSFSVLGADVTAARIGPLSSSKLTAGRTFTGSDARASVALIDANYAAQNKLRPGSVITVGNSDGGGTGFTVIGVVQAPRGATPADVYIPLARAQALGTAPQGGAGLDEDTGDEIVAVLEQMWRDRGLTLVIVTHDSSVARRAQRTGLMNHGQLDIRPYRPTLAT